MSREGLRAAGQPVWGPKYPVECGQQKESVRPRRGQIYTIRSIEYGPCLYTRRWTVGFHLKELRTIQDRLGFLAHRFAPISEQTDRACKTSLSELVKEVGDAAMKSLAEEIKRERSRNGKSEK